MFQGDQQPFQNVGALAGFFKLELGPAGDHHLAVVQVNLERFLQRQGARFPVHQRQHLHAKSGLQRRVLVQLVEHDLRLGAFLNFQHNAHTHAVGFVAQVGDVFNSAFAHQLSDAFDQAGFIHLVGNFADDNLGPPARGGTDLSHTAHHQPAAPVGIGLADTLFADDLPAGREIGSGQEAHQVFDGNIVCGLVVVYQVHQGGAQLAQVVGRDIGCHADGDAGGAVEQQVGQPGGKHHGFF